MTAGRPARLLELWARPPDERSDPVGDFAAVYAEPVVVNGTPMKLEELVARARAMHATFADLTTEVVDEVDTPDKLALAFRQSGRHIGPWRTPLGVVAPTGRVVSGLGIDILTFAEDRITEIWVLADELQRLAGIGALALREP